MAKFIAIFVFCVFLAVNQATPVVKRDVNEVVRHHVPGHVVYGNGISGHAAETVTEHFEIDGIGNYHFG